MQKYLDIDYSRKHKGTYWKIHQKRVAMKRKTHGKLNLQKHKTSGVGGAEPSCWCDDRSLAVVKKWLQLADDGKY